MYSSRDFSGGQRKHSTTLEIVLFSDLGFNNVVSSCTQHLVQVLPPLYFEIWICCPSWICFLEKSLCACHFVHTFDCVLCVVCTSLYTVCVHLYILLCVCVFVHVCVCVHVRVCMYVWMCVCAHACVCIFVYWNLCIPCVYKWKLYVAGLFWSHTNVLVIWAVLSFV